MNGLFHVDYFALPLISDLKNKTMDMQIILIYNAQIDFNMKLEIAYFKMSKLIIFFIEK